MLRNLLDEENYNYTVEVVPEEACYNYSFIKLLQDLDEYKDIIVSSMMAGPEYNFPIKLNKYKSKITRKVYIKFLTNEEMKNKGDFYGVLLAMNVSYSISLEGKMYLTFSTKEADIVPIYYGIGTSSNQRRSKDYSYTFVISAPNFDKYYKEWVLQSLH